MKENYKILIMNHHGDELINKWTLEYIKKAKEYNTDISIYLENVEYVKHQDLPKEELEKLGLKEEITYCVDNGEEHNAFAAIPQELFKLKIFAKGLLDTSLEHKKELEEENYKKHDEFMLNIIQKAQGSFIAVIGAAHITQWYLSKLISPKEYIIILPNHKGLVQSLKTEEYDLTDCYILLKTTPDIDVIDIECSMGEVGILDLN